MTAGWRCWGHLLCIHDRPGTFERRGYWVLPTRLRIPDEQQARCGVGILFFPLTVCPLWAPPPPPTK